MMEIAQVYGLRSGVACNELFAGVHAALLVR
jgi:hypothetical protein